MVRLYATGTVGFTEGYKWIYNAPTGGDFDADNDGVISPIIGGLVDLSDVASKILGQQVSQSTSFTIRRINMALKNVDDNYDNDEGNWFAGTLRWYHPTEHRKNALALARQAEKFSEGDEMDGDAFFLSTDNDYSGMRFGWMPNTGDAEPDQVRYQTSEDFSQLDGTQWNLSSLFAIYNDMHPATKSNALWGGRAGNATCKIPYTVANASGQGTGDAPALKTDWNSGSIIADCLAGLLYFTVADSGGAEDGPPSSTIDDDYQMVIGIEFDVGVDA